MAASDPPISNPRETSVSQPATTAAPKALEKLEPSECAFVFDIEAPDDDADRLKAMGVCVGRRVELLKRGDPLILRVLGSRIGLSARLARRVKVITCDAPECHPG